MDCGLRLGGQDRLRRQVTVAAGGDLARLDTVRGATCWWPAPWGREAEIEVSHRAAAVGNSNPGRTVDRDCSPVGRETSPGWHALLPLTWTSATTGAPIRSLVGSGADDGAESPRVEQRGLTVGCGRLRRCQHPIAHRGRRTGCLRQPVPQSGDPADAYLEVTTVRPGPAGRRPHGRARGRGPNPRRRGGELPRRGARDDGRVGSVPRTGLRWAVRERRRTGRLR